MDSRMIWMVYTPLNLSNESKITQSGVHTKKIWPCEFKGGFSKTMQEAPLKVCAFLVFLMDFNDYKFYIEGFYTSKAFQLY